MKKLKYIEAKTPSESRRIQKKLFSLGYGWSGGESFLDVWKSEFPIGIILEGRKLTYANMYYIMHNKYFEPLKLFKIEEIEV